MFETLTKGFRQARNRLQGVTELTEDNIDPALQDVRVSLLEADVELGVVKRFLERVKSQAVGQEVRTVAKHKGEKTKVGPAEQFVKICQDELEKMMSYEGPPVEFAPAPQPTGIMVVGLQGSGKTTTAAKLAGLLENEYQRKPLLVAADMQRPGAVDQLKTLGERIETPVFSSPEDSSIDVCEKAIGHARHLKRDTIVYDTAGRLAVDEPLMQELEEIKKRVQPTDVFLVVDAMIGQDSVKTAKAFHDRLGLTGVILTKLDGDARGGAALSVKEVTGAPVTFAGTGETLDRIEQFRPDGMASRILGMGDVVGLMKDFEGVLDAEKAEEDAQRMLKGSFTFDDFLEQISAIQQMGPLQDVLEKLPGFADSVPEGFQLDERELDKTRAMVSSMTRQERRNPDLFQKEASRIRRVAKGSGRTEKEVAELLQRFTFMRQMMGNIGQQAGMLSKVPGMKQMASARKLREVVQTGGGGLENNPMMANLADELLEAAVAGQGSGSGGGNQGSSTRRKTVDRNKKKQLRKMQKKSRKKSRK